MSYLLVSVRPTDHSLFAYPWVAHILNYQDYSLRSRYRMALGAMSEPADSLFRGLVPTQEVDGARVGRATEVWTRLGIRTADRGRPRRAREPRPRMRVRPTDGGRPGRRAHGGGCGVRTTDAGRPGTMQAGARWPPGRRGAWRGIRTTGGGRPGGDEGVDQGRPVAFIGGLRWRRTDSAIPLS